MSDSPSSTLRPPSTLRLPSLLQRPSTLRPRWMPIGVYRTCSLPPLPLPKPTPRVKWVHPDKKKKLKEENLEDLNPTL